MSIGIGTKVSIEYTLTLEDGSVVDTNEGAEPLSYVHGESQIIPGLERSLEGMEVGEKKTVSVEPDDAYGAVDDEAFLEVSKERVPESARRLGAVVHGQAENGQVFTARVAEVGEESLVLDFNHPLAGKTLLFDVTVLAIEGPEPA